MRDMRTFYIKVKDNRLEDVEVQDIRVRRGDRGIQHGQ